MSRTSGQKLKILHILSFLQRESDPDHPVTMAQITEYLASNGVPAERKSVYDDIEVLRTFGIDIVSTRAPVPGYFIGEREFQLPELKLLVDSVQSSKFITQKKSLELIEKIEKLTSRWGGASLHRQVYVKNRIKAMNEAIYYNVDTIHTGIGSDRKISFQYFEYSVQKERVFRHGGMRYLVSPFALIWDDENYYLAAYDENAAAIKHFRVDKMYAISVTDEPRGAREIFDNIDMSSYSRRHFGMFTGTAEPVKLEFENGLAGAVIDRFGRDIPFIPTDDEHFSVTVNIAVSPQFFGWVCGFGGRVRILSPNSIVEKMKEHLAEISAMY